jgi:hypothetical protein
MYGIYSFKTIEYSIECDLPFRQDGDIQDGLPYSLRWLVLPWIIGWWVNFLYRLNVLDLLASRISGVIPAWLR